MGSFLPVALLGLVVGLRHATEADHVAAVSAIVARERTVRGAALIGAAWGLGHTLTLLLLGGAIVAFGLSVPRSVALSLELLVGAMLIGLGLWNFAARSSRDRASHAHGPSHDRASHAHGPSHDRAHDPSDDPSSTIPRASSLRASVRRALRPLVVGSMHGLAGSAAAALLVAATARTAISGVAYLVVLGLGTMLGMTAITAALALPLGKALRRFDRAEIWLRVGSGAVSCAIGALVVYQIGFQDGLFLR